MICSEQLREEIWSAFENPSQVTKTGAVKLASKMVQRYNNYPFIGHIVVTTTRQGVQKKHPFTHYDEACKFMKEERQKIVNSLIS